MGELGQQLPTKNMTPPNAEMKKIGVIIDSMTIRERQNHKGFKRIASSEESRMAAALQVQDVNKLVKQFEDAKK